MKAGWLIDAVPRRLTVADQLDCPITQINREIRSLLGERISRFISNLGQHLKRKILFGATPVPLLLMASTSQSDFREFSPSPCDEDDSPSKKAIIYARVSSHKQTKSNDSNEDDDEGDESHSDGATEDSPSEDDGSIEGQIEELKQLARDRDLELAAEPFTDKAKTGTNFDRPGIQSVFKFAQRDEVGYLLVEKIDRIGRSAAETLYFIYILQTECDVTLLTPSGERDVGEIQGLMHTTLLSLMAEIQNEIRTAKATKERVRSFVVKHNWKASSPVVPLGYDEKDDGWVEVNSDEKQAIIDLFDRFTNPEYRSEEDPDQVSYASYAGTERAIDDKYGSDLLDGHRVKTLLKNPVYVGKPEIPESWVVDLPYENVVEDPDLQIIDEETFDKAQEIIEEKDAKHSTDEDTYGLLDFIEEFDLFSIVLSSENATLLHDCGNPMIQDGQRTVDGQIKTHLFYCKECDEHRKWPKEYEYERMKIIHMLLDDNVAFLEVLEEIASYLWD